MQDRYYADHRDLLKWGVLYCLAERFRLSRIIQVAYLRPSIFPMIDIGGQEMKLPPQVRTHFRNIRNITSLHGDILISVFDRMFDDRRAYQDVVTQYLTESGPELRLVFLDPDTGLEPKRRPDFRHVLDTEAHAIWSKIKTNEVFAFYQHKTNRAGRPWIEEKRTQLEKAIKAEKGAVMVGRSPSIANDVVIFYAIKP